MPEITIKDIAKICGVGVSTVSRAINNYPDINPETRKQIQDVIEQYGYIPNNSARNLKRTESNAVAILIKGITNPLFYRMIKVFDEKLKKNKLSMILQHVSYEEDEVTVALELIKEKRLKGIIFLGANYYHSKGAVEKIQIPFVFSTVGAVAEDEDSTRYSHVTVDDERESYKMVDYLVRMGHRQIALIAAEKKNSSVGRLRMEGYLKALRDHQISVNEKLICLVSDDVEHYSMKNGYLTTRRLLDSGEKFTAIFAMADIMAIGVYRALFEAGLRIPEDVSVVGYDGIELGDYVYPKLTTMAQPVEQIALATVELLQELMEGKCRNRTMFFAGELMEKDSVKKII